MTFEAAKARDEQLVAAFAVLLTHGHVFAIDSQSDFWIERLPSGRFAVCREWGGEDQMPREEFDDAPSAIRYFLDLCEDVIRS